MRVVIALDSFKGSISAPEACGAVAQGIRRVIPGADVVLKPMADGGEGTAATVMEAAAGAWVTVEAAGPRAPTRVEAGYAWLPPGNAMVEMARASGLDLLRPEELDPLVTTTYGTGELLAHALARGPGTLWLAIGGSATVDGGIGAAQALGWRFLDAGTRPVGEGGAALERVRHIEPPEAGWEPGALVEVLCDVDNPLLGPRGAAAVFGPQKGATPEVVERLEAGLANLAEVIQADLGLDVRDIPGAGAAGGLGAAAVAFLSARLIPGVEAVMDAVDLAGALDTADWVITGEGRFDEQSLHGKVVSGVASRARAAGCRVAVLAGSVEVEPEAARQHGVTHARAASPPEMPLEEAMARGAELLEEAAADLARTLLDDPLDTP